MITAKSLAFRVAHEPQNTAAMYGLLMLYLDKFKTNPNYQFFPRLPISVEEKIEKETYERKRFFFFGEKVERTRTVYFYSIVFEEALTKEELIWWQGFIVGYWSGKRI